MTKKELLEKLNSLDDLVKVTLIPVNEVIKLVNDLEDESSSTINDDLINSIVSELEDLDMDMIDDYSLEMSYREVELLNITLNSSNIEGAIRQAIKNNQ
jgi:hypothetical protein